MSTVLRYDVYPSLPARNWDELQSTANTLIGHTTYFQVDIVDGVFASPPAWPFSEGDTPALTAWQKIHEIAAVFTVEVDCMVLEPRQYFIALKEAGVARLVIHLGTSADMKATIATAVGMGFVVGLGVHTKNQKSEYDELLPLVAYVQVMGIAVVGAQGQPFDERALATIADLRAEYPELTIAVDGSVNADTIPRLLAAGANSFAPGSAVTKAADPIAALKELQAVINRVAL